MTENEMEYSKKAYCIEYVYGEFDEKDDKEEEKEKKEREREKK